MGFSIDWEEFPRTYRWKDAINFVAGKEMQTDGINGILDILIKEGNTVEDEALTVAVLRKCWEENKCTLDEIVNRYGVNVSKAVQLIARKEENFEQYIERIFNVDEFKYIRKIIVANVIYELRRKKVLQNEISKDIIEKVKHILKYEEKTNRELIRRLRNEISKE